MIIHDFLNCKFWLALWILIKDHRLQVILPRHQRPLHGFNSGIIFEWFCHKTILFLSLCWLIIFKAFGNSAWNSPSFHPSISAYFSKRALMLTSYNYFKIDFHFPCLICFIDISFFFNIRIGSSKNLRRISSRATSSLVTWKLIGEIAS